MQMREKPEWAKRGPGESPRPRRKQRKKAYKAYLREMTSQGLMNTADGSFVSYTRSTALTGGMSTWKAMFCGSHPNVMLPAFGLHAKVNKK